MESNMSRDCQKWSSVPPVCFAKMHICMCFCVFFAIYLETLNPGCSFLQSMHVPGHACITLLYVFVCVVQRSICHLFRVKG